MDLAQTFDKVVIEVQLFSTSNLCVYDSARLRAQREKENVSAGIHFQRAPRRDWLKNGNFDSHSALYVARLFSSFLSAK